MQQQEQKKKKLKKSYAELLEEFMSTKKRIAVVYIPLLCEALKDENPDMKYTDIKDKIVYDAEQQGWDKQYILRCLPSWLVEDDPRHKLAVKNWEKRHANQIKESYKKFDLYTKQTPEPPEPKESYEHEDLDLEGGRLAIYGEKGKLISQQKGDITYHTARLFEALTEIDHLPHKDEDLILDYVKPTRQYRKSLILELDEQSRKTVWNALGAVEAVIQDTLDLLEEEQKK